MEEPGLFALGLARTQPHSLPLPRGAGRSHAVPQAGSATSRSPPSSEGARVWAHGAKHSSRRGLDDPSRGTHVEAQLLWRFALSRLTTRIDAP